MMMNTTTPDKSIKLPTINTLLLVCSITVLLLNIAYSNAADYRRDPTDPTTIWWEENGKVGKLVPVMTFKPSLSMSEEVGDFGDGIVFFAKEETLTGQRNAYARFFQDNFDDMIRESELTRNNFNSLSKIANVNEEFGFTMGIVIDPSLSPKMSHAYAQPLTTHIYRADIAINATPGRGSASIVTLHPSYLESNWSELPDQYQAEIIKSTVFHEGGHVNAAAHGIVPPVVYEHPELSGTNLQEEFENLGVTDSPRGDFNENAYRRERKKLPLLDAYPPVTFGSFLAGFKISEPIAHGRWVNSVLEYRYRTSFNLPDLMDCDSDSTMSLEY